MATEETDVVIVGSGVAGSVYAAKMAQSGKHVVLLEGGPARGLRDMVSSQIWARRIHWGGATAPPIEVAGKQHMRPLYSSGWGTGGTGAHHYAAWFRLHPEDFREHSLFGRGVDWPIGYDDLRPFYDRVQREVGISGDARAEVWRPPGDPYPMPALATLAQGTLLRRGFDRIGMRTAPIPYAINSREYQGRPACIYDGWCDAGCPIGALANPQAVYLAQAQKAGAELRNDAQVSRVLTDTAGKRATGVEYHTADGAVHVLNARLVVLAAFVTQTPRILLNSHSNAHPNGLANSSGTVGKYFFPHVNAFVYGLYNQETEPYLGVTYGQLVSQDRYLKAGTASPNSYQWIVAPAMKPNDLGGVAFSKTDIWGDQLDAFMKRSMHHIAVLNVLGETLPQAQNRVELGKERDRFGLPAARVVFDYSPAERALYDRAVAEGTRVHKAAGATEVWHGSLGNSHLMGGTRMGADRATSVVDSYGVTHDVPNLVIASPGLYPTTGAVNPTYTLTALTYRSVDHMIRQWSSL